MARYLFEMSLAPQAFATLVKNPQDRLEATRPMIERLGGTMEAYYFGVGGNNIFVICEFPDPVATEALTMAVLAGGALTFSRATLILTAAEAVEAMKKAGKVAYQPPSS